VNTTVSITITASISTSGWWRCAGVDVDGGVGVDIGVSAIERVMDGGSRLIGQIRRCPIVVIIIGKGKGYGRIAFSRMRGREIGNHDSPALFTYSYYGCLWCYFSVFAVSNLD